MEIKRYRNAPPELRFWTKVEKTESCWIWRAGTNAKGYGTFTWDKGQSKRLSHRLAYEQMHGPVPDGMVIDHTCWNRACVRPDHLRPVSSRANSQNRKGAKATNSNGFRGVSRASSGRFTASATMNGEYYYLGIFDTAEQAGEVAANWRRANMPESTMDKRKELA